MLAANIFANLPQLETERLVLRRFTLDDAQDLLECASDPEVPKYTSWEQHKTIDDAIQTINQIMSIYDDTGTKRWTWGIEHKADDNKLIGTFTIWGEPEHARAEIGYILGRPYWGQGLVSEAAREVLRFGFNELGLNRIQASCDLENIASARVMEKNGMTYEGTLRDWLFTKGKYANFKMYSVLRREYYRQED